MLRLVAKGGRAAEQLMVGGQGLGSVAVGVRTLSEVGTVGDWDRRQVRKLAYTCHVSTTIMPAPANTHPCHHRNNRKKTVRTQTQRPKPRDPNPEIQTQTQRPKPRDLTPAVETFLD
jgi:hypothetical protein